MDKQESKARYYMDNYGDLWGVRASRGYFKAASSSDDGETWTFCEKLPWCRTFELAQDDLDYYVQVTMCAGGPWVEVEFDEQESLQNYD